MKISERVDRAKELMARSERLRDRPWLRVGLLLRAAWHATLADLRARRMEYRIDRWATRAERRLRHEHNDLKVTVRRMPWQEKEKT